MAGGGGVTFGENAVENLTTNRVKPPCAGTEQWQSDEREGSSIQGWLGCHAHAGGVECLSDPFEKPLHLRPGCCRC